MRKIIGCLILVSASLGCGSSYPPPTQPLADVQAADRTAQELGADSIPEANLHLQYARDQTKEARRLMRDGKNERAAELLTRAKADAEVAVALAHEQRAKVEVQQAMNRARQVNPNMNPGVRQ